MRLRVLGDVSFLVVHLRRDHPGPPLLEPLLRLVETGALRVLDFLVIEPTADGERRIVEIDRDDFRLAGLGLYAPGLISDGDVHHFTPWLPRDGVAAVVLVEQTWDLRFLREVEAGGDRVIAQQAIPAAIANAALASTLRPGA